VIHTIWPQLYAAYMIVYYNK